MGSDSNRTEAKRRRRKSQAGRADKKARAAAGTPKFPIHPEKPAK